MDQDQDLADLLCAWLGGDIAEARQAEVLVRLREDAAFRRAVVQELHLLGMLKVLRTTPRWLRLEDELGWSADEQSSTKDLADAVSAQVELLPSPRVAGPVRGWRLVRRRQALAAAIPALIVVVGIAAWFALRLSPAPPGVQAAAIALLVRLEGPGWEGASKPTEDSVVRTGELSLRGGSATLAFFNGVRLHMEGPADVDLQSPNRVFCRRGKLRIDAPMDSSGFAALAPGASVTDPAAEFALSVENDRSEVMVFEGQAEVALVDSNEQPVRSALLTNGQSVRLDPQAGLISAPAHAPDTFAGPIPQLDPRLILAPEYPEVVRASRPVGYWRFESADRGLVASEMPGGPSLRLIGQAAPFGPEVGNRSLNFPPPTEWEQHAALADRPWTPPAQEYAVECWAMPRVVRHAVMVGLVAERNAAVLTQYGIVLELTGQPAVFRHPERSVRALHRFPVGQVRGVNLFTPATYLPYRWQHLVAQRSRTRFELYLDGELAAVAPITVDAPLPPFRVLLGALYARRDGTSVSERPFVGLIDEAAVYDHPLPAADIQRRARLGWSVRAPE
jgi:hypothetical protein